MCCISYISLWNNFLSLWYLYHQCLLVCELFCSLLLDHFNLLSTFLRLYQISRFFNHRILLYHPWVLLVCHYRINSICITTKFYHQLILVQCHQVCLFCILVMLVQCLNLYLLLDCQLTIWIVTSMSQSYPQLNYNLLWIFDHYF